MRILVTGGLGYIGSHTCVELINAGHDVVILDNLSNSHISVLQRINKITRKEVFFVQGDVRDRSVLQGIFQSHCIDATIHFAGLKAVGESVSKPLEYYDNNVTGSLALLEIMAAFGVKKIIFSSSATVYGNPVAVPITEDFSLSVTNPYGRSKLIVEDVLRDLAVADPTWHIVILRYFNPVGAHETGLIGEEPNGIPNNLLPYVAQVAMGMREKLLVYGDDYDTPDGTGVRDYIHVVDLASGHVSALEKNMSSKGLFTYNLGTGHGTSVLEMLRAFEKACGFTIPYQIVERRQGDIAKCFADASLAAEELGWSALRNVEKMCVDAWEFQRNRQDISNL